MTTVTHNTGCPSTRTGGTGGTGGPCLCIGDRPFAARPTPTPFRLTQDLPLQRNGRVGDTHRQAARRRGPTVLERAAASAGLAAAGRRWLDAYDWATSTGRAGAEDLHRNSIHPPTVAAYLEFLEN